MARNRSRAGTGTGPFFGELRHLATHTLAENTDLSPSLPARERLRRRYTARHTESTNQPRESYR